MYEEDFILREVKRLAQALARAVGLRTEQPQPKLALAELEGAYRDLFGLDPALLRFATPEALRASLGQRAPHLAQLLEEEARTRAALGERDRADALFEKARAVRE